MNYSIWLDHHNKDNYSKLKEDINTDILIIGGGISGVSSAYHLINSNLNVVLVERNRIGEGISARTTGKLTFLQGNIYSKLNKMYSFDVAKLYLESQLDSIKLVKSIIKNNNIECDFTKQTSYLFANNKSDINKLKEEKNILLKMNLNIDEKSIPIDIENYYSISSKDTYYFHPVKYIKSLTKICFKNGINIYENTNIIKIKKEKDKYICYTNSNKIVTKYLIIASHYPYFLFPYLFPLKSYNEKSYISASNISNIKNISGINLNKDTVSFRYYKDNFIYLNGSHNIAFKYNESNNFNNLVSKSMNNNINYLWSNTDIITNDYLPYIGKIDNNLYIETGYNTWGMTNGSIAGLIIKDLILNNKNKYEELFNPKRSMSFFGKINTFKNIFSIVKPFIENKIIKNKSFYNSKIKFTKINGKNVAMYIDEQNKKHVVYSTCPHLKCTLIFNEVEKTWDCPCHASRFTIDGKCIIGPSNKDITYKD